MTDTAARLAIFARRFEVCRFTIAVAGIDMTGVTMAMQVRLGRDVPGAPLVALATVGTEAAEGLKFDSVTVINGIPTSIIKGRINKTTMDTLPYAGEVGDDTTLAYAMQWTLGGDARTRLYGDFVVQASAFGSDAAPANRPLGSGSVTSGATTGGTLQFGDQVVRVSIDGIDALGVLITEVEASALQAANAADTVINTNLTLGINPDSRVTTRLGDDSGTTYNGNGVGFLFFASDPTPSYGRITSVRASFGGSNGNGTSLQAYIVVISPDENGAFKVSARVNLNQYYEALTSYPVEIYAPAGSYVTIRSFFWPVNLRPTGGPGGFYAATTGADAGVGSPVSLTFGAETIAISYELETVPNSLDERLSDISDKLAVLPAKPRFSPHQITLVRQAFATLPATGTGTGDHWTYAGGAWAATNGLIASSPGWGTYAVWNGGYSSIARRLFQTEITSPSSADIGGICTVPLEGYSGGVAVVDRPAGKLRLYAWTGSGAGTLMREAALPAGTGARRYRIIVDRDDLEITVTCADLETGDTASVTGYNLIPAAAFHGRMGVIALAGAPEFETFRVTAPYRSDPLAVIVGDSITDGWNVYTPPNLSWASKLAFGRDDIIVAGRSGDETANFLLRSQIDLLGRTPKLGILALGTNDYVLDEWRANIAGLITSMQALGIEPVLVTVPPRGGETLRQAQNTDIRSGYFGRLRYIDMSRALTLNHDGVNWNPVMNSGDSIHPSDAGAEAMRQRALIDIPELAI